MDEITYSVLWHDRETNARLVRAFYHLSMLNKQKYLIYLSVERSGSYY